MSLIKWSEEGGQVRLGLPSDLDLAMAQPLADALRHALSGASPVTVQADAVERVSTACIQALLAATLHAKEKGLAFVVARPSETLTETCDDLGLAAWLSQWSQA